MEESPAGQGIYDGFEGYRDPTEDDVVSLLKTCPVILDTNVLLDIYTFEEPARVVALKVLERIRPQLWIPHQVMREFWRNRHSWIADLQPTPLPTDGVRDGLRQIINSLRPDRERSEEIEEIRASIEAQLDDLAAAISQVRGTPLEVARILHDTSLDPVLGRLESILEGRIGTSFGDDEATVIAEGRKRFDSEIPPGYEDGKKKADQRPEHGTGDYLLWEQSLRYLAELPLATEAFVLVTNDAKEDWRIVVSPRGGKKHTLGVRPELVAEALERTGRRLVLLQQGDFYRLMDKIMPSDDEAASESLVEASTLASTDGARDETQWTSDAYERLLAMLREAGNQVQANIILLAARAGGFIPRAAIYERAGYHEERSLKRFAFPAQRTALVLLEAGLLPEDAAPPLEAIYDGPGKAIGYRVPPEFADFEAQRTAQPTWVQAAAQVAVTEPDRVWAISDLVAEIERRGLRDMSTAQTPDATLRRDLSSRDDTYFDRVDGGFKLRPDHPPAS